MGGDEQAFDDFVAARGRALVRTAYLLCGDRSRAEDLVQTALAKAWVRWDRVGGMDNAEGYVRRVLFHDFLSWWRRDRREVAVAEVPETAGRGDHARAVSDRHDVTAALRRLPKGQRAVVVLRFYDDLTEAQAAAVLGCSVGTVKSQTSRALARLRADEGLTAEGVR
ncbi:MAG TPA: SigE family RNA polymerase sigma factor [Mycobacteriales bacterium]|nr:SigE family RNA polymerase sigma factor [Mycobacteriales bacterium]